MQVNNGPMFGFLGMGKTDKNDKAKHPHHAGHAAHHKAHAAHHKHHQKPAFGAMTASGDSVSFSGRKPKPHD